VCLCVCVVIDVGVGVDVIVCVCVCVCVYTCHVNDMPVTADGTLSISAIGLEGCIEQTIGEQFRCNPSATVERLPVGGSL